MVPLRRPARDGPRAAKGLGRLGHAGLDDFAHHFAQMPRSSYTSACRAAGAVVQDVLQVVVASAEPSSSGAGAAGPSGAARSTAATRSVAGRSSSPWSRPWTARHRLRGGRGAGPCPDDRLRHAEELGSADDLRLPVEDILENGTGAARQARGVRGQPRPARGGGRDRRRPACPRRRTSRTSRAAVTDVVARGRRVPSPSTCRSRTSSSSARNCGSEVSPYVTECPDLRPAGAQAGPEARPLGAASPSRSSGAGAARRCRGCGRRRSPGSRPTRGPYATP